MTDVSTITGTGGGAGDSEESARAEAAALRRASELLAEALHDAQRRLAAEAALAAKVSERQGKKARRQPVAYVDLAPYEGMPDKDVLLALGSRKDMLSYYKRALQLERERLHRPSERDDVGRCQAGVPAQLGLRCRRTALAREKWCAQHHPDPPASALSPEGIRRDRLSREQLWQRPDGRVLQALYELTDSVHELTVAARETLDRARDLEAAAADKRAASWLSATEAATYTRRSRRVVSEAARAGRLSGVREGPRGSWSFRPADLDVWLENGRCSTGRYQTAPAAPGRRRSNRPRLQGLVARRA
jgi:hypothetical protein